LKGWRERREREKEGVELVIYCLKIRVSRLEQMLEDYLLCRMSSCEGCPGSKGDSACEDYYGNIKVILGKLRAQMKKWIEESVRAQG